MSNYPQPLLTLIALFKKFPGIGSKTAERFAFQLMSWTPDQLRQLGEEISQLKDKVISCSVCGCLKDGGPCLFCSNSLRDPSLICLVSSAKDVYAIEETRSYKGLYHVIPGLLSPMKGHFSEGIDLRSLQKRLEALRPSEAIIALDSTLEGDATSLYLKQELEKWGVRTSRLAFGLPMGSSLDYVDYGTLERALKGRNAF